MIDTLKSVSLPEGAEITLRLAGPLPRAIAWLADTLLRVGIMMLMGMAAGFMGRAGQGFFMIGFFALWELYPIVFEGLWEGATPGKRMMNIAVVNGDGTPLRWRAAILRNVLRFADMLPFGYAAGLTSMVMDRQFRRLGDLAAGTVVIHRDAPGASRPARRKAAPVPAAVAPFAPAVRLTPLEQRAILDFAERKPTWSAERAAELAALASPLVGRLEGAAAVERLDGVAAALVERR